MFSDLGDIDSVYTHTDKPMNINPPLLVFYVLMIGKAVWSLQSFSLYCTSLDSSKKCCAHCWGILVSVLARLRERQPPLGPYLDTRTMILKIILNI